MNRQPGRIGTYLVIDRDAGCRIFLSEQSGDITEQIIRWTAETGCTKTERSLPRHLTRTERYRQDLLR